MAFKKDTRKRVRIINADPFYLNGMIGRLGDYMMVMVGPTTIPYNEANMKVLD